MVRPTNPIADGATVLSGVFTIPQPHRAAGLPFFAGPENRLAAVASRHVLDPGCHHAAYFPLVICAPTGCGKTHLAQALGEAWNASHSDRKVHEFAAVEILKQASVRTILAAAASKSETPASMFVIENLEQTAKQTSMQHRLRLLIDTAQLVGSRIVITSRVSPASLDGLSAALRSRLCGGLVISLAQPSFAARSAIVAAYADTAGLKLSPKAIGRIAQQDNQTPAQVIRSVATLQQNIASSHAAAEVVEDSHVEDHLESDDASRPTQVSEIAAAVAKQFQLKIGDLKGRSRRSGVTHARSLAMYLAWQQGDYSLKRIGQYFGGRDHSTVLHACRKIEQLVRHDAATRQRIVEIKELLCSRTPAILQG